MNRARLLALLSSLSLVLLPTAALSQEEGPPNNPGDRILRGHTLLFPTLQQSAVVSTHVGIREGLAEVKAEQLPLGQLGPRDVSFTGLQQTIDLSLRFTPWLALYLDAQGQLLLGTNGISLLQRGAAFTKSADAGLAFRLLRKEDSGSQLTARVFGGVSSGRDVTVLPLLLSAVNQPGATLGQILEGNATDFLIVPTESRSFGLGLHFAQVFSRAFSLQASVAARRTTLTESPFDVVLGANVEEDLRTFRLNTGLALTYDFQAHGVPVALLGEYLFALGNRSGGSGGLSDDIQSSTVALGVYYSARPNLQLGATVVRLLNAEPLLGTTPEELPAESEKPSLSYAQLILRYVW
jgi:hypothetical protein